MSNLWIVMFSILKGLWYQYTTLYMKMGIIVLCHKPKHLHSQPFTRPGIRWWTKRSNYICLLSQILDYHFLFSILKESHSSAAMDEASCDALTARRVDIIVFAEAGEVYTISAIVVNKTYKPKHLEMLNTNYNAFPPLTF